MSNLNYRFLVMLSYSADSLHHQHDVSILKIEDKTNNPTSANLMVITVSCVRCILYLLLNYRSNMRIAQQGFGLRIRFKLNKNIQPSFGH